MRFPIPGYKAKNAAQDFASDARKLAVEALRMKLAIDNGEGNKSDNEDYKMLIEQIRSFAETEFYCTETGKLYYVKDYFTPYRLELTQKKETKLRSLYARIISFLR
jgi:hypothetical protein